MTPDLAGVAPPQGLARASAPAVVGRQVLPPGLLHQVTAVGWEEGTLGFRVETSLGLTVRLLPLYDEGVGAVFVLSECCLSDCGRCSREGVGELQYCRACGQFTTNPLSPFEGELLENAAEAVQAWGVRLTSPLELPVIAAELSEDFLMLQATLAPELEEKLKTGAVKLQ